MAKIIPIDSTIKKTALPLTGLMIKALKIACRMQKNNQSFGQIDVDGSFTSLVQRKLIDAKQKMVNGRKEVQWYVTPAGKRALSNAVKKSC